MRHFAFLLGLVAVVDLPAQAWQVWGLDNSPLPSSTVKCLLEDPQGGIWVGTDWGLCHFDGNETWEIYQVGGSGLPSNDIVDLALAADGGLWIATGDGLVLKDGSSWTTYTTENSGIPENDARGLFVDHLDRLWVATPGGLARLSNTEWVVFDDSPESHGGLVLNTHNMNCVAVRPDGLVLLGTFNGGLHFLTETSASFLTTFLHNFYDNTASAVLFDPSNGDRWVATPAGGLLRQRGPAEGGIWFQWNTSVGFPSNGITCIDMDPGGRVWAGTQAFGLIRVQGDESFMQYTAANSGLPDDEVRSVLATDDGAVWVGTIYGGLARLSPNVSVEEHALENTTVFPNPARTVANVRTPDSGELLHWHLYSAKGELLASGQGRGQLSVPVQGIAPGIHVLKVMGLHFVESKRLVVEEN